MILIDLLHFFQVLSLCIVAIGVYARVQKATGMTKKKVFTSPMTARYI